MRVTEKSRVNLCNPCLNLNSLSDFIEIKGARVNNLKNVDVKIPRNKFIVIAGVSGSGKSSLAFDTLYAEGQRRYVESLSSYVRQFLGRMNKPECDFIKGIPPAIAIEQKVNSRNPRSTVGTSTEIYEYLRLLYARIGRTYSPISGEEVKKHTTEDIVQKMLEYSSGTRFVVMAPIHLPEGRTMEQQLKAYMLEGYARIYRPPKFFAERSGKAERGGDRGLNEVEFMRIDEYLETCATSDPQPPNLGGLDLYLVIDRLSADNTPDNIARLVDSAETAFYEGNGSCRLLFPPSNIFYDFSMKY